METTAATGRHPGARRGTGRRRRLLGSAALAGLGGVLLTGLGAWSWWDQAASESGLSVEPEFSPTLILAPGESRRVAFRISNRHRASPARLLGASDVCGPEGCTTTLGLPMTIPPGLSAVLAVDFKAVEPGRFTRTWDLYTDRPGQSAIPLTIATVVEPPAP